MKKLFNISLFSAWLFLLAACVASPTETPQIIYITEEVFVTKVLDTPTPRILVITTTPTPTQSPVPPTPTRSISHDWVDYGGICVRPDNLPDGVQISSTKEDVGDARTKIVGALWHLIEASGSMDRTTPRFSSRSNFLLGTLSGSTVNGPLVPVGKKSRSWLFRLEEPVSIWEASHPSQSTSGVALDIFCIEFYDPMEFEKHKLSDLNPPFVKITLPRSGDLTSAIFAIEEVYGSPRMVIKLLKNPFGEAGLYRDFHAFQSSNTATQNALAANDHLGVVLACLNQVDWANHDGDTSFEFGYHWRYNVEPLPVSVFRILDLFIPAQ